MCMHKTKTEEKKVINRHGKKWVLAMLVSKMHTKQKFNVIAEIMYLGGP